MRAWAAEEAGVADWLFQESYDAVGDIAETIALLLPPPERSSDRPLAEWVEGRLLPLRGRGEDDQHAAMLDAWRQLDDRQRFVWNKLISGGFRVGVSQQLVTRALGEAGGHRPGRRGASADGRLGAHARLLRAAAWPATRPMPTSAAPIRSFLAHALEQPLEDLGDRAEWQAEWKWDGIRSQLIRRGGRTFLWSRGEELVTERYPELAAVGDALPDGTAIDGEILPWSEGRVLPFAQLQRRIGRKAVTKAILAQVPVVIIAYDLLELGGEDIRGRPLDERRAALAERVAALGVEYPDAGAPAPALADRRGPELGGAGQRLGRQPRDAGRGPDAQAARFGLWRRPSPRRLVEVEGPAAHDRRRAHRRPARQRQAREPVYRLHLRRLGQGARQLVPIAKAYSGLTDAEIRQVDAFVRRNMVEKFGPVRTVKPELVFELAFEGLNRSSRHKSGIAVRFPRILRWRTDKPAAEADSLDSVRALLPPETRAETAAPDRPWRRSQQPRKTRRGIDARIVEVLQAMFRAMRVSRPSMPPPVLHAPAISTGDPELDPLVSFLRAWFAREIEAGKTLVIQDRTARSIRSSRGDRTRPTSITSSRRLPTGSRPG